MNILSQNLQYYKIKNSKPRIREPLPAFLEQPIQLKAPPTILSRSQSSNAIYQMSKQQYDTLMIQKEKLDKLLHKSQSR